MRHLDVVVLITCLAFLVLWARLSEPVAARVVVFHPAGPPRGLSMLVPHYLRAIPTCPSAALDTYSSSFVSQSNPDGYSFHCAGDWHLSVTGRSNLPEYPPHRFSCGH